MTSTRHARSVCSAILGAFLALLGATALADAARPPFAPLDVFDLEWASDPQISPDGAEIAYVRRFQDIKTDRRRGSLWLVSADGSRHQPLGGGSFSESNPRWSPDGRRLAYVGADSDGSAQVFVRYLDSGATARVTNLLEAPTDIAWSPDGHWLAFIMRVPETRTPLEVPLPATPKGAQWADPLKVIDRVVYRADGEGYLPDARAQLFVVPAEGGSARQLTRGPYDHRGGLAWSADSREILVSANRHEDADYVPLNSEIYAVRVADGDIRAVTDRFGPDTSPAVSPDGRRIAWIGFDDRKRGYQRQRLYVADAGGSNRRELLADLDRDITSPVFSRDGKSLYFEYVDQGTTRVGLTGLDGKLRVAVSELGSEVISRPYGSASFSVARDGRIAFMAGDATHPPDVAVARPGAAPQRLTDLNGELLSQRTLSAAEELWLTSSADGRRVQAWLMKPPGFDPARKYPLILEIHGGPFENYGPRFGAELQLYAAAGYVVLFVNPRGSTSYGEEFGNLIHHRYPGQDYDDLMSAVDAAIGKGYVDAERLYVTGGSGGGVLTAWIVGSTKRFRAAAVQKPVINWASFALTADSTNFFSQYWFAAQPWEQPEEYWKRSPLSLVGNVATPTMVVTGELDYRTPIAESEQFYQALKLRKVDTLLVRVPGASHSFDARPSQLVARVQYILAWFAKYGGPPVPAAAR